MPKLQPPIASLVHLHFMMLVVVMIGCTSFADDAADASTTINQIVFTRLVEEKEDAVSAHDEFARAFGAGDLMISHRDGSHVRTIMEANGRSIVDPVLSPNGQHIAFAELAMEEDASSGLWVVKTDGSDAKRIFKGDIVGPAWSPDGTQIAFSTPSGDSRANQQAVVHIIGADGTNDRVVGEGLYPDWSPDGEALLVTILTGKEWHTYLARLPINGDEPEPVVDAPAMTGAWSPDGKHIAYARVQMEAETSEVIIADADGGNARTLLSSDDPKAQFYYRPRWLSDGEHLLVNGTWEDADGDMHRDLMIVNVNTGATQPLFDQMDTTNTSVIGVMVVLHWY